MNFISTLSRNALSSFNRFPLVVLWTTLGSVFLISVYATDNFDYIKTFEALSLILILGVSWLIGTQFISESLKHNALNRFVFKGVALILLGLFYYYLHVVKQDLSEVEVERFFLLLLAGHVLVVFAPFIKSWHSEKFWNYLKSMFFAISKSVFYAVVLFIGLSLAIAAFDFLFDFKFNTYIYLQNFIFCLGIVNTFIFLNDFPKLDDLEDKIEFSKAIEVLVNYILIPLSLLYIVIVYAYAIKIVIEWELPRGWVTYLISALSILAFVIHIAIEPVREQHSSKFIQKFFPRYFYAIIPLLPLLFIGLYKRISDYNFTELRYLGLVLAIWIAVMLFYMLFSKTKRLSFYAKLLFIFIMISTFGPLSAFKISVNAQISELQELMSSTDIVKTKSFTEEQYKRFASIVTYLGYRDELHKTESIFGFNPEEKFSNSSTYRMPKKIADNLNIDITKANIPNISANKSYRLKAFTPNYAEEITEYTHFTELKFDNAIDKSMALQLVYDDANIISFTYYGEPLLQTDLTSHLKTMADKYDYLSEATQDEFTFRFKNEYGDFLIIISSLSYNAEGQNMSIVNGEAKLFYRTFEPLELP
jgi:hypothetical protein